MQVPRWMRRRRPQEPCASECTQGQREAREALRRAEQGRRTAERRGAAVSEQAAALRGLREANHFAEMFRRSLQGGQP